MRGLIFIIILILLGTGCSRMPGSNKAESDVLMTVDQVPVTRGEFIYMLTKNDPDSNFSETEIRNYLELYRNFKLKVTEARQLGYDTLPALLNEFNGYRQQLIEPYLRLEEVSDSLIRAAYERSRYEIRASHILIDTRQRTNGEAYKMAIDLRQQAIEGADFSELARKHSDDPSASSNGGDLGYFTSFRMVYPFEVTAFNTKEGDISPPVKTRFGYHIIKVLDKRPVRPQLKLAHILIRGADDGNAGKRIFQVHELLEDGSNWDEICLQYSEDPNSRTQGGELPWIGPGRTVPAFEEAAYTLETPGQISDPVQTPYGWHIIKLLEIREAPGFDQAKNDIERQLQRTAGSEIAREALAEKLKETYGYRQNEANLNQILLFTEGKTSQLKLLPDSLQQLAVASFADITVYGSDLADSTRQNPEEDLLVWYNKYLDRKVLDYEEQQIIRSHPELGFLINEYYEGLLLFEIMDDRIWSKAAEDTTGLQQYFENHRSDYQWEERMSAILISGKRNDISPGVLKEVSYIVERSEPATWLDTLKLYSSSKELIFEEGIFERGTKQVIDSANWNLPVQEINLESLSYVVVNRKTLPKGLKELNEIKGIVIADYQDHLDSLWIGDLTSRYPVEINERVLEKIINRFDSR